MGYTRYAHRRARARANTHMCAPSERGGVGAAAGSLPLARAYYSVCVRGRVRAQDCEFLDYYIYFIYYYIFIIILSARARARLRVPCVVSTFSEYLCYYYIYFIYYYIFIIILSGV